MSLFIAGKFWETFKVFPLVAVILWKTNFPLTNHIGVLEEVWIHNFTITVKALTRHESLVRDAKIIRDGQRFLKPAPIS